MLGAGYLFLIIIKKVVRKGFFSSIIGKTQEKKGCIDMKDSWKRRLCFCTGVLFVLAMLGGCGPQNIPVSGPQTENMQVVKTEEITQTNVVEEEPASDTETDTLKSPAPLQDDESISEANPNETDTPVQEDSNDSADSTLCTPASGGALHVEGTQLTDSNGNAVQLRGISTHGIAWYPDYINEECFKQLRTEWNVNVIRLALYTAEYNGYCTGGSQDRLKALVKDGVAYATAQDMYVIIDWHILSDLTPKLYQEEAKRFFTEMASEYSGYDNVLYEICNEPNGGTSWPEIKDYAQDIIGTIRQYDKDAVIIVGTPNWSQFVDQAAADPITGYDNLMYTLHFYAATHTDDLRNKMVTAHEAGLPIFVSEYGICDASGNGAIDIAQAEKWVEAMNACGISYVVWNLSNKEETSSLISSNCWKTSDFAYSDLSESGKWVYDMLTEGD